MCWPALVWFILHTGSSLVGPVQCDINNFINTVVVNCTSNGPAISVTWARRSSLTSKKQDEATSQTSSCCSIKIRNVSLQTSYLCLADQMDTTELLLQVQYSPILPHWRKNYYEVVTCQGYDVELTCDANGGKRTAHSGWRRRRDTTLFTGEFMVLANIRRNEKCDIYEGNKTNITFVVEYPPVIFVPTQEITGARDSEAILQCLVEGFPPPKITWYKDGGALGSGENYLYESFVEPGQNCSQGATLRIITVFNNSSNSTEGFGNYTCLAENKHGRTSAVLRLVEIRNETMAQEEIRRFNVTGFIIGMMPPLLISFYIIIRLGYRSRYAEERADEDGLREERFFVSY